LIKNPALSRLQADYLFGQTFTTRLHDSGYERRVVRDGLVRRFVKSADDPWILLCRERFRDRAALSDKGRLDAASELLGLPYLPLDLYLDIGVFIGEKGTRGIAQEWLLRPEATPQNTDSVMSAWPGDLLPEALYLVIYHMYDKGRYASVSAVWRRLPVRYLAGGYALFYVRHGALRSSSASACWYSSSYLGYALRRIMPCDTQVFLDALAARSSAAIVDWVGHLSAEEVSALSPDVLVTLLASPAADIRQAARGSLVRSAAAPS
jgi:hypothetical protein